jgi:hypothetical protein
MQKYLITIFKSEQLAQKILVYLEFPSCITLAEYKKWLKLLDKWLLNGIIYIIIIFRYFVVHYALL